MHKKIRVTEYACKCERCGHEWISRKLIKACASTRCKSLYWDRPIVRPRMSRIIKDVRAGKYSTDKLKAGAYD